MRQVDPPGEHRHHAAGCVHAHDLEVGAGAEHRQDVTGLRVVKIHDDGVDVVQVERTRAGSTVFCGFSTSVGNTTCSGPVFVALRPRNTRPTL